MGKGGPCRDTDPSQVHRPPLAAPCPTTSLAVALAGDGPAPAPHWPGPGLELRSGPPTAPLPTPPLRGPGPVPPQPLPGRRLLPGSCGCAGRRRTGSAPPPVQCFARSLRERGRSDGRETRGVWGGGPGCLKGRHPKAGPRPVKRCHTRGEDRQ